MYRGSLNQQMWAWLVRHVRRRSDPFDGPGLVALTAAYDPAAHGVYVRHLQQVLAASSDRRIRNIALTGDYGSGKSSVLEEVASARANRTITISLSTLGDDYTAAADDEQSGKTAIFRQTNRIQKEVVTQLLYREKPSTVRNSRFRRVSRFSWRGQVSFAALAAGAVLAVLYGAGLVDRFVTLFGNSSQAALYGYVVVYLFVAAAIVTVRYMAAGRLSVTAVGAGPATVTLSDRSESFFDEYLDEIVYFFEATKYDTVIFEDIDRFENPYIFETLRELNTILNQCKQLGGRPIRFVYALRDSIFEQSGPAPSTGDVGASDDAVRARQRVNRTKFFDLIIPIVPFITHVTARDLVSRQIWPIASISPRLLEVVAAHVTDMRLIKNIRNEFVIFEEKLRCHLRENLAGVSEDSLFALLAYKNFHLSDFELIKTGDSRLDHLYRAGRQLVDANISYINQQLYPVKYALAHEGDLGTRAAELGDRLNKYLLRLLRHLGYAGLRGPCSVSFEGFHATETFNEPSNGFNEIRTVGFWAALLDMSHDKTVHIQTEEGVTLSIALGDMEIALGEHLSSTTWTADHRAQCMARLTQLEQDITFLRQATLAELVQRQDLRINPCDPRSMNLDELVQQTLTSDLARQLVRTGYINWNFAVYVGDYYGTYLSTSALNFIVRHVHRNEIGLSEMLSGRDVEDILREHPEILGERAIYNISIVYYLASQPSTDRRLGTVLQSLMKWGTDEQRFLTEYLRRYDGHSLIGGLSLVWPRILVIIGDLDVSHRVKLSALDDALSTAHSSVGYEVNDWVRNAIRDNYSALSVFTDPRYRTPIWQVCDMLEYLGVRLPSLQHLNDDLRAEVIERRLYIPTADNLADAATRTEHRVHAVDRQAYAEPEGYLHAAGHLE